MKVGGILEEFLQATQRRKFAHMGRQLQVLQCMGVLLIGLALSLLLVACSPSSHQTYRYDIPDAPAETLWHPGKQPVLHWKAQPVAVTTDAAPAQIELTVALIGPLASEHAPTATGPLAVAATPILTDSWSGKDFTSVLDLSPTLQAGTYALRLSVKEQSSTNTSTRTRDIRVFITP